MRLEGTLLQSRVARRVFFLFVLSALIPVVITGVLSFTQVNKLMVGQTQTHLRQLSKGYGLAIFNRIEMADERLREIAARENIDNAATNGRGDKRFSALALSYPTLGRIEAIMGSAEHFEPIRDKVGKVVKFQETVVLNSTSPGGLARVYLALGLGSHGSPPAVLIGELDSDYLWARDSLALDLNYCVLSAKLQPLYCTAAFPALARQALRERRARSSTGVLEWRHEGVRYLAGYWELFLKSRFQAPGWLLVTSEDEARAFAAVGIFKRIYPPVIAVSIVLVALLSMNQIRRTLVPLAKLIAGTRRLANRDFDARVSITSGDEFAELAASMNDMAQRLGRQFNTLAILSEMDQQILSKLEAQRIVDTVLKRIDKIVSCQSVCITLMDRDAPTMAVNYVRDSAVGDAPRVERITLDREEMREVLATPQGLCFEGGARQRAYITAISRSGSVSFLVFAIRYRDRVYGLFSLGFSEGHNPDPDERPQLRELSDRIAVALSAVEREEQLFRQAHYDVLTGLPNRQLFHDRLEQHLVHADRKDHAMALLFLDLDRFKTVNDTLGHSTGDSLLKLAAERLKKCIGNTDTAARLMGDEFTIILSRIDSPWSAGVVADRVIEQLSKPFLLGQQEHHLGASVGIAVYPEDGTTAEDLLRNADTAMYKAKDAGRGMKMFFKQEMNAEITERMVLENDLRYALGRNELFLVYQPKVDIDTGKVVGAETLIRWQHPTRGLISPLVFISIAEDTGLIESIGEWILNTACRQFMTWQLQGTPIKHIAVNVSMRQLSGDGFVVGVREILDLTAIPPECLELEITESLMMADLSQTMDMLRELHDMGVRIAIDDFGTGYSSLSYLQKLPFDSLKIDQSFIKPVTPEKHTQVIASTIIVMAHALNKTVVAEGIETAEHAAFLQAQRCEIGQGYYYSRPLPAGEFIEFVYGRRSADGHGAHIG